MDEMDRITQLISVADRDRSELGLGVQVPKSGIDRRDQGGF
jgi:hypothetical protein